MRLPSLNALRAFEAASRHLNFRLAAEELGVTQGAVAQQVRALEAELGLRLFERLPRSLALTQHGRSYAATLTQAFELISDGTRALKPQSVRLTISVTPTFASKWLVPRLGDFAAANPSIELAIVASERVTAFQADGIDLSVRHGRQPKAASLMADLLFDDLLVPVCAPGLVSDADLSRPSEVQPKIPLLHDGHDHWPAFLAACPGGAPSKASAGIRFNHTDMAIDAALNGQGVALASRIYVEPYLRSGRLINPFGQEMTGNSGFFIVTARKPRMPAATAAVRSWLLSHRTAGITI